MRHPWFEQSEGRVGITITAKDATGNITTGFSGTSTAFTAGLEENGGLVLRFRMHNANHRGTGVLHLQHSNDLGNGDDWTSVLISDNTESVGGVGFVITPDGNQNEIFATILMAHATGGRLFARLLLVPTASP